MRIVKHMYLASKMNYKKDNWYHGIGIIFDKYGLSKVWNNNEILFNLDGKHNNGAGNMNQHKRFWKTYVKKKILDYEESNWLNLMHNKDKYRKLRTYVMFKNKLRLENYLLITSNIYGKAIHTSLRSGTNNLEIDMGRRDNLKVEDRICRYCDSKETESEYHFLIDCKKYENYRFELFNNIVRISNGKWDLFKMNKFDQFMILMNGTQDLYEKDIFNKFHSSLANCFKMRLDTENEVV